MKKEKSAAPFQIIPPVDTPEYLYPAYFSCLLWSVGFQPILDQFKADTGNVFSPPRSGIEAMIDKATGHNPAEDFVRAYMPWFNNNVWGKVDGVDMDE